MIIMKCSPTISSLEASGRGMMVAVSLLSLTSSLTTVMLIHWDTPSLINSTLLLGPRYKSSPSEIKCVLQFWLAKVSLPNHLNAGFEGMHGHCTYSNVLYKYASKSECHSIIRVKILPACTIYYAKNARSSSLLIMEAYNLDRYLVIIILRWQP